MIQSEVLERFAGLRVWRRSGERAPHKPLLVLYALGRLASGDARLRYDEIDVALDRLLREFGPVRKSIHPELPFWHLRSDGVWQAHTTTPMRVREGSGNPLRSELLRGGAEGSFTPEVLAAFRSDPTLLMAVAHNVLDAHFPSSVHEDLLTAVGLEGIAATTLSIRKVRDPRFRSRVLTAYDGRCAICGFSVRLGHVAVGLDAAHIRWHQAGGPDDITNGLALCTLHHKLFDRGALTVSLGYRIELSEHLHGGAGFDSFLLAYHGKPMQSPQTGAYYPAPEFLGWHHREVFQGPPRPNAATI